MTATADLAWDVLEGFPSPSNITLPAANAATYYHGVMIADVAGVATKVTAAAGLKIIGWCLNNKFTADTSKIGQDTISIQRGVRGYSISGTDAVTASDQWTVVFAEGDNVIAKTSAGGTLSPAGLLIRVVGTTAYVAVGHFDAASLVTKNLTGFIGISVNDFREVSSGGDVGDTTANGGLLASDTTPILRGDAAESQEISWASSNSDIIMAQVVLPPDFDGTGDVTVDLWVYSGGTTNAATFTVETGWDGGALVSDTATGAASTSLQKTTATVAAADIPNTARLLTIMLTPAAHTTDTMQLRGVGINFKRS